MNFKELCRKFGLNPRAKKSYQSLFNRKNASAQVVLDDLLIRFGYYGSQFDSNPTVMARKAAHKEVIDYILMMSARLGGNTIEEIEKFINGKGD